MDNIIAGTFDGMAHARKAIDGLAAAGFKLERIASVPVGQRDDGQAGSALDAVDADGSDESISEQRAGDGAVTGTLKGVGIGAVFGLLGLPVLGPAAPLAGAAVGAYVGSLAGALDATEAVPAHATGHEAEPADGGGSPARSNQMVTVAAASPAEKEKAITVLRAHGADVLQSFEGSIIGGALRHPGRIMVS
jgi:hypothetical protein